MEESSITHHHHLHQPDDSLNDDVPDNMRSAESKQERDALKGHDDIHVEERAKTGEVESKLASMHLKEKEKISGLPEET